MPCFGGVHGYARAETNLDRVKEASNPGRSIAVFQKWQDMVDEVSMVWLGALDISVVLVIIKGEPIEIALKQLRASQ